MALSTSSSRWALGLLLCVAVASTINIEPVDASRRELQQQYRRGGRGGYGGKDCEFEGVWTKHLDFFTSKAGKRCKCVDGKWRDCTDAYYKDDYKEPEIKVVYVKEEPKKKEFKDCEIYFEWIKHGDWHVYDDKECRCWDGKFDSCKDLKKPEVVKLVYKEEPKKEFKDCEKDGVWTSHGSQYSSPKSYERCRCWDGIWDSCIYEFPW